jgi:hypothetical protein
MSSRTSVADRRPRGDPCKALWDLGCHFMLMGQLHVFGSDIRGFRPSSVRGTILQVISKVIRRMGLTSSDYHAGVWGCTYQYLTIWDSIPYIYISKYNHINGMIIFTTNLWMHQSNLKISSKTAGLCLRRNARSVWTRGSSRGGDRGKNVKMGRPLCDQTSYLSGWWFGTRLVFFHIGIIIPTDFHIFQRGRNTTN